MRTTLTLDEDVAYQLTELAHNTRKPFKQVVNETLRRGLHSSAKTPLKPFKVKPLKVKLAPGVDERRLNQLYDELEVEDFIRKFGKDL